MKKYFGFKQNNIDPSPESITTMNKIIDFCFKFAEYTLIAGVFSFLAVSTKNWAVGVIAGILVVLLGAHILSLVSGIQYFLWREATTWWLKAILFALDAAIFVGVYYTLYTAFFAVFRVMKTGIGI